MPPINAPLWKLRIGGHLSTPQTWSCSLWIAINGSPPPQTQSTNDQCLAAMAGTPLTTFVTAAKITMFSDAQVDNASLYYYLPNQHLSNLVSSQAVGPFVGTGTLSASNTQAMVCSLRSGVPGRSGRGRIYWPATGVIPNAAPHQFNATTCTTVANACAAYINALNALNLTTLNCPAQIVGVASFAKSQLNKITKVIVDSLPDAQDRRQDKAVSLFQQSAIVT